MFELSLLIKKVVMVCAIIHILMITEDNGNVSPENNNFKINYYRNSTFKRNVRVFLVKISAEKALINISGFLIHSRTWLALKTCYLCLVRRSRYADYFGLSHALHYTCTKTFSINSYEVKLMCPFQKAKQFSTYLCHLILSQYNVIYQ
jgi:hypothetical protein